MMTRKKDRLWFAFILVAAFAILGAISISRMNQVLLSNAQIMGTEIAERFSVTEESYIVRYELLLNTGAEGMEVEIQKGRSMEELNVWIQQFLNNMSQLMELHGLELYGSVNNRIVAATYWEGDATFDPSGTEWYQKAIAANGKIIYTTAYTDARLQQTVVTIARSINNNRDVLAVDLYPELFTNWPSLDSAPDGTRYFLCDSTGTLLHFESYGEEGETEKNIQEHVSSLVSYIKTGNNLASDEFITDMDGQQRGLYYHQASNGWISIITIPKDYLLSGSTPVRTFYLVIVISALLICGGLLVTSARSDQQADLYNKIARVLGNSYYALYMVDFENSTYSMLKGSDYIRGALKPMGEYAAFLDSLEKIIEPDAYVEFRESFSIENIRELVQKNVRNFGGDFRRLFNSQYRWVHVQLLYDESLPGNEVVLCFRDVNTAKEKDLQQTQLLKDSLHAAQQNNESKTIFFSSMSHDMRTPLNAIIGLSELAQNHMTDPEQLKDDIRKIKIAGQQLLELVNDILEISRMEQGKQELNLHEFNLRDRLMECLDIFQVQAEAQKKYLSANIDIHHANLIGDWFKLQQIINNLLSNALKFTPQGGTIGVEVQEFSDPDNKYPKFQFTISDTGIGMSEEFLKKLFTPFEREKRFAVANITGTGLGMSIVHSLVAQMEGRIEVESALNKGTTFTVTLPMMVDEKSLSEEKILPDSGTAAPIDMTGKRVLLAEDNAINMEISTELLQMRNFEVTQAWDGKEALELFQSHEPGYFDVILLDMQMPVMDGCQAAEAIRSLDRDDARTIPIVAVTANAFAEDIAKTQSAGMNAHISKPIDLNVLERTLQSLL